jgi:hypothetical protein
MASEFGGHGQMLVQGRTIVAPKFFGSYALFSIQKDWIEPHKDDLSVRFEERLLHDPVLLPVAGPEHVDQYARWVPLDRWLGGLGNELRGYAVQVKSASDGDSDGSEEVPRGEVVVRLRSTCPENV